uniref:Uncharacterized protein n=1 Tax=Anguilla anguilla TaxID=7936 RepID=A0A0E9WBD0_ANGAN
MQAICVQIVVPCGCHIAGMRHTFSLRYNFQEHKVCRPSNQIVLPIHRVCLSV